MLTRPAIRRRAHNVGAAPGTISVQNTRRHHTADEPPGTSATTRLYLSLHRLSESRASVPILETRSNAFAQPRCSSPSLSDSSEVLRYTVRFPPRPPTRREGSIARNHVIQCDGDLQRPRERRVDTALHVPLKGGSVRRRPRRLMPVVRALRHVRRRTPWNKIRGIEERSRKGR